jgi:anti-sigma factor RsiW
MTDCPKGEVRDLLPDLVHERLAPHVRREVDAHVRSCADCQREVALLRAMRVALRRAPAIDVAAVAAAIPAYRAPARRSWASWRVAAAIMILTAGGTSVALLGRGRDVADSAIVGAASRTPAAGATLAGAPRELALGSGAVGDLNDGELSTLLKNLATVDVIPSMDVESPTVSPIPPAGIQ